MASSTLASLERAAGFSDAVLGIVATILVVPLTNIPDQQVENVLYEKGTTLYGVLTSTYQLSNIAIFYAVFLLTTGAWMRHARAFDGLKGVDQLLVTVNWVELLAISLLPLIATTAAFATAASGGNRTPEQLLALNIFAIACVHLTFNVCAIWYRDDRRVGVKYAIEGAIEVAVTGIVYAVSGESPAVMILYVAAPAGVFLCRLGFAGWRCSRKIFAEDLFVPKERLNVFTDGVMAIAATLIILDIKPPTDCADVGKASSSLSPAGVVEGWQQCQLLASSGCTPNKDSLKCFLVPASCSGTSGTPLCIYSQDDSGRDDGGETSTGGGAGALGGNLHQIFSYIMAFVLINILWQTHHRIMDRAPAKLGLLPVLFNAHLLVFVSMVPFGFGVFMDFVQLFDPSDSEQIKEILAKIFDATDPDAVYVASSLACLILLAASACCVGLFLSVSIPCCNGCCNDDHNHNNGGDDDSSYGGGGGGGGSRSKVSWGQFTWSLTRYLVVPVIVTLNLLILVGGKSEQTCMLYPLLAIPAVFGILNVVERCCCPAHASQAALSIDENDPLARPFANGGAA